jgi:hypothetical protein
MGDDFLQTYKSVTKIGHTYSCTEIILSFQLLV